MRFISPRLHGIIDYLVVAFLLAAPGIFNLEGKSALFAFILGGVHLLLTLFTNFSLGVIKAIPLTIHGFIEVIVGLALIVLSYTYFKSDMAANNFYLYLGIAILLVWLFTDYKRELQV